MKKKKVTHAAVQAAVEKFLKEGGKIKKLGQDESGVDIRQRVDELEMNIAQGSHRFPKIDPVPFENKIGWRAH